MSAADFHGFVIKKAFEISYALCRLAYNMKSSGFGAHLENQALALLSVVASYEYAKARTAITVIEYLLRLGADTNIIHPSNSQIIIQEVKSLDSAIAEFGNSAILPNIDLSGIFSENIAPSKPTKKEYASKNKAINSEIDSENEIYEHSKVEIRKSAIIDRIRQFGNCRMRDIQESFPVVSERALRYDLQNLIEQGIIERIGKQGPTSYYRLKTTIEPMYPP